jgi:hypothetical protein
MTDLCRVQCRGCDEGMPGLCRVVSRLRAVRGRLQNDRAPTGPCGLVDGIEGGGRIARDYGRVMRRVHHMRPPGAYPLEASQKPPQRPSCL